MLKMIHLPAFTENYIWTLVNSLNSEATVVDPGNADPVLTYLRDNQLKLNSILLTHHHWDHTDGVNALLEHFPNASVYASHMSSIKLITNRVKEGDVVNLNNMEISFEVDEIPGHTLDHLSYFADAELTDNKIKPSSSLNLTTPILFTGDTLFLAGCGKVFEGTTDQMWASLQKIKNHRLNTEVYCGHEYTLSNLKFASTVEPTNSDIQARLSQVRSMRSQNKPSVPALLSLELKTNPFLRTDIPDVIRAVEKYANKKFSSGAEVFAALREWKNNF
jgi:hydroxyacylglutathione hydrolase